MAKVWVDIDFLENGLVAICAAVRQKTGGTGLLAFPVEITEAIESIETGSGGITPTGTKTITENGEGIDVTTYAAVDVAVPSSGSDTSDATAGAADIAADKTAYIATGKTTGSAVVRTGSDLTEGSDGKIMVPAGIYRASTSKSVTPAVQATPDVSVNQEGLITATASQSAGYVDAGSKSATLQLPVKAAETFTPGTTDQEIPAGKFTTGKQTIKGDARLVPSNIRSGVQIFGVTGTYGGSGTAEIYLKTANFVTVSRTDTKTLDISGLNVSSGETLIGLVLLSNENVGATSNFYADAITLLPTATGWIGIATVYLNGVTQFGVSQEFSLTKYGQTACQLKSTGNVNFVGSYQVMPFVARVN